MERPRGLGEPRRAPSHRESCLVAILALLLLLPLELGANGGMLRLANLTMGAYRVSIYTDPTPVRPDSLDVSVLVVQEGLVGVPEGLEVLVRPRPLREPGPEREVRATREQADDPRYYAAKFGLGVEGPWEIVVEVRGEAGQGSASFEVIAREPGLLGHPAALILMLFLPLALAGWWLLRQDS